MKPFCLFVIVVFYCNVIIAQDDGAVCPSPADCSRNLAAPVFQDNQITIYNDINGKTINYAKQAQTQFRDVSYNIPQGNCSVADCTSDSSELKYYVYFPSPAAYPYRNGCKLPAVFIVHGGAYSDCGATIDAPSIVKLCTELAKRGFVAFNIEYRRGNYALSGSPYYSAQQLLAIYRAGQDIRGAIRSIIKKELLGTQPYRIDTSKLFLGGGSAGSLAALTATYYSQAMLNQVFPGISSPSVLGRIDRDFYFGDSIIKYTIKGQLNMWGALVIPQNKLSNPASFFSTAPNKCPIISFHGALDLTFNVDKQDLRFYPVNIGNGIFNSTNFCTQGGTFTSYPSSPGPDGYLLGAARIYNMFKTGLMLPTEVYIDCNMEHGLDDDSSGTPHYKSNFGTTDTTTDQTSTYIAGRTATFFQAVMSGVAANLSHTRFVDCENKRIKCIDPNVPPDDNGCSNNDNCN